jgi:hypothetical protein
MRRNYIPDAEVAYSEHDVRVSRQRPIAEEASEMQALLLSLGKTVDEVVETLTREDCRGPQQNDCFCPVAQFLAKKTGRAASSTVHVCVVGNFTYEHGHIDTFIGTEWAKTPKPVAEVIEGFDRGRFPVLDDPERTTYYGYDFNK